MAPGWRRSATQGDRRGVRATGRLRPYRLWMRSAPPGNSGTIRPSASHNGVVEDQATLALAREELCWMLSGDDTASRLREAVRSGRMDEIVPEFSVLQMEQDPDHRHKDVLAHTIAVVGMAPDDLLVRLAALFHDIGKPRTRSYEHGEVTFRNHEAVGANMTRKRLRALGFDRATVDDVSQLVRLSGRFKGYDSGWGDAAVRRYARDAGHLLGRLNQLVRSDCTTRFASRRRRLHRQVDHLERRISQLAAQARREAERPQINGDQVMTHLGVGPGPHVGAALAWLLELKRSEGEIELDELYRRLDRWWSQNRP